MLTTFKPSKPGSETLLYNVPIVHSDIYQRSDLLKALEERVALTSLPLPIVGPTGYGKTSLVLAYINKHAEKYKKIIWLNAASASLFMEECLALSKVLETQTLPIQNNAASLPMVLKKALTSIEDWLLVIDGVVDSRLVEIQALPIHMQGKIIITSVCEHLENALDVTALTIKDAVSRLASKAIPEQDNSSAEEIAKALYYHPGAIEMVCKTIASTYYNRSLKKYWHELQQESFQVDLADKSKQMQQALRLSIGHSLNLLKKNQPNFFDASIAYLTLCSYFLKVNLPHKEISEWFQQHHSSIYVDDVLKLLEEYGYLIDKRHDENKLYFPPFLLDYLREIDSKREQNVNQAMTIIDNKFKLSRVDLKYQLTDSDHYWAMQAEQVLAYAEASNVLLLKKLYLFNSLGRYYYSQDLIAEAQCNYSDAKRSFENYIDTNNVTAVKVLIGAATVEERKDFIEKIRISSQELYDAITVYAKDVLHNAGFTLLRLWEQCLPVDRQQALPAIQLAYNLQQAFLKNNEETFSVTYLDRDKDAHSLAYTKRGIARLYKKQGDLVAAEKLLLELDSDSDYIGLKQWPETKGLSLMDLGAIKRLLADQNHDDHAKKEGYAESERLLVQSIRHYEQLNYPRKNLDLLVSHIRLAETHMATKNYSAASKHLVEARRLHQLFFLEKVTLHLGRIAYRQAEIAKAENKLDIAEVYIHEALGYQKKIYRSTHPYIKASEMLLSKLTMLKQQSGPDTSCYKEDFKAQVIDAFAGIYREYKERQTGDNETLTTAQLVLSGVGKLMGAVEEGKAPGEILEMISEQKGLAIKHKANRIVKAYERFDDSLEQLDNYIEKLFHNFESQIRKLDRDSLNKLTRWVALVLVESLWWQSLPSDKKLEYAWYRGFYNYPGKVKIKCHDGTTWSTTGLFQRSAVIIEGGASFFARKNKSQDKHDKYGFHLEQAGTPEIRNLFTQYSCEADADEALKKYHAKSICNLQ